MLDAEEHPSDGVSVSTEDGQETAFAFAIGIGRDVGRRAALSDLVANDVGITALVGVRDVALGKLVEQLSAGRAIGYLAACNHKSDRAALSIGKRGCSS